MATSTLESNVMLLDPDQPSTDFHGFDVDEEKDDFSDADQSASDVEMSSDEEELERLVFGDSGGFRLGLEKHGKARRRQALAVKDEDVKTEDEADNTGMGAVADADLFFMDAGPDRSDDALAIAPRANAGSDRESEADQSQGEQPAWEDSDDARISVSLLAVNRLRKLRRFEGEDVINGKEYIRRLRKQYEVLNPRPDWARQSTSRPRKKRRTDSGSSSEGSDSEAMDIDASTQPLARLLQSSESLTGSVRLAGGSKRLKLRQDVVDIQPLRDLDTKDSAPVSTLQIHKSLPLLLSSNTSGNIYLHHLSPNTPEPNPLLTSVHVKGTPINGASFSSSSTDPRIFLSGTKSYFSVWDLASGRVERLRKIYEDQRQDRGIADFKISPDGKYVALLAPAQKEGGVINIVDSSTLQWVAQARIDSLKGIADFQWWGDGKGLCVAGLNGEVTEWELASRRALVRWKDEGSVGTTKLALGGSSGKEFLGGDRWVAIGSSTGIVNIYDRRVWAAEHITATAKLPPTTTTLTNGTTPSKPSLNGNSSSSPPRLIPINPTPTRVLDNLVTSISTLTFSPDGQVLCMASRLKPAALRLVHLPSCLVYKNWPTMGTPLKRVETVAWGQSEGELWLCVGNQRGKVTMWSIRG